MRESFTVIENTPGYLPMDDDPPSFDNYDDAVSYLNERAAEYADDADANYRVEYGLASEDNLAAVVVWDDDKSHDLGLVIQIVRDEPDDDDELAVEHEQTGLWFVWNGSHTVNVRNTRDGQDHDCYSIGDFAKDAASEQEFRQSITSYVRDRFDTDEQPDDDEPDDDDAFITDTSRGYSIAYAGKFLGECSEWDDAVAMVREAMDAGKFWPNVWHINDHGNTDLVTIEPAHCGCWKPETHLDRGSIDCGCGWGAYCELSSEYVGSEAERFGIEQARALLEGTAGYETRQEPR